MVRRSRYDYSLRRASRDAGRAFARTRVDGLSGLFERLRDAVQASESLAQLLERVVCEGFRRRTPGIAVLPSEVRAATSAARATIGALANTTPSMFSNRFDEYAVRVDELMAIAERVAMYGVAIHGDEDDE